MPRRRALPAFTLVELILVMAIIGVLAAIAVPRFSRGQSAAAEVALSADLRQMRAAITTYALEHNNIYPGPDAGGFDKQLTYYTSLAGDTSDKHTSTYRFGPYLQAIPRCPVGENANGTKANLALISATSPPTPDPASGEGWVYNPTTGEILPNTDALNADGKKFIEAAAEAVAAVKH